MPGLRERQKRRRRAAILRAAAALFAARGYDETGMQDIAGRARVAVGTVYNYFPAKPELVLALVERHVGEALARAERILAQPPDDPVEAVTGLLCADLAPLAHYDRTLWSELVRAALADPEIAASFFASDVQLIGQLAALLRKIEARGDLRSGLDPGRAAIALYGVFFTWLMVFVTSEAVPLDAVRDEIRRGAALVMNGMLAPGGAWRQR